MGDVTALHASAAIAPIAKQVLTASQTDLNARNPYGADMRAVEIMATAGFSVFPVYAPYDRFYDQARFQDKEKKLRGKVPVAWNWSKTPYKLPQSLVRSKFHNRNFGVSLPSWCVVIDVDISGNKRGDESFLKLCDDLNLDLEALCTAAVDTGSGGKHLFFRLPAGTKIKTRLLDYPDIDFLSEGKQVIGFTSVHNSGNRYMARLNKSEFDKLSLAPESLVKLISREETERIHNSGLEDYDDSEPTVERAVTFLNLFRPSIEGHNGDNTTFEACCKLRAIGVSPEKAVELVETVYNLRCEPQWDYEDIVRIVNNAYTYAKGNIGENNPKAIFKDASEYEGQQEPPQDTRAPILDAGLLALDDDIWRSRLRTNPPDKFGRVSLCKNEFRNTSLLCEFLEELRGVIAYNEFEETVVLRRTPPWINDPDNKIESMANGRRWVDSDTVQLKGFLDNYEISDTWRNGYQTTVSVIEEAIVYIAHKNKFHPVRDFLDSAERMWDGEKRVGTWLTDYLNVPDNEYTREVGRILLMALVARIYNPGHKFDYMVILEGAQGIAKSLFCKTLAVKPEWFTDSPFDMADPRNIVEKTAGKWIVEFPELAFFDRNSVNAVKRYISTTTDAARPAFGRHLKVTPRQNIPLGTTNEDEYLLDQTGNRRFAPIRPMYIDIAGLKEVLPSLYGETVTEFKRVRETFKSTDTPLDEYKICISDPKAQEMALAEQKDRMPIDARVDTVTSMMNQRCDSPPSGTVVDENGFIIEISALTAAVWIFGLSASKVTRREQLEVGRILVAAGWERVRRRVDTGERQTVYTRSLKSVNSQLTV